MFFCQTLVCCFWASVCVGYGLVFAKREQTDFLEICVVTIELVSFCGFLNQSRPGNFVTQRLVGVKTIS